MINTVNTLHKLIKNRFDINTQSIIDDAVYKIREYVIDKESIEPLTEQQIDDILTSEEADSGGSHRFARAIEKAHGIE